VPEGLRFGMSARSALDRRAWLDMARRCERWGFDTFWVPDHVGVFDPFAGLVAASAVTDRVRLGTYVLNVEFWNPLLLARVAATTDIVTGGRLVLGLGAGHAEVEFRQAGLAYPPPARRAARLEATLAAVRRLLAGETVDDTGLGLQGAAVGLRTRQERVPLLVGGNGDRVLRLAGAHADAAGLVGFASGSGQTHQRLSHWSWAGLAERIAHVQGAARSAGRSQDPAIDVLVQRVIVTGDRETAVAELAAATGTAAGDHLDSPFVLVGTGAEIAAQLHRMHELGVAAVTVFESAAEALAPVIARLRG
jgi:probable F420-dependent oxidoreductase